MSADGGLPTVSQRFRSIMSSIDSPRKITMNTPVAAALRFSLIFLVSAVAYADSAQWNLNPTSGDWNTTANWTPMTIPNGPADMATFALSNTANVSISEDTEVNNIAFTPGATSPYLITASPELTLTISDVGIVNNSGMTQNFVTAVDETGNFGQIVFTNSATAGTSIIFINDGSAADFVLGGETAFFDASTAANGTFVNEGSTGPRSGGGSTEFYDSSTAGNANFTNKDGIGTSTSATVFHNTSTAANGFFTNDGAGILGFVFAEGGQTIFYDTSTAANGTFTNNGATVSGGFGGATDFDDGSTAANGIFINNGGAASGVAAHGGGTTYFVRTSTAGNGTFINNAATASGAESGVTEFGILPDDPPSAGNGTFINNGATISDAVGGKTAFYEASTAESATLIANGGTNGGDGGAIFFEENSTGGTVRVEVFGNGTLDVSGHNSPGVTIGSIEGEGDVFLGTNNLAVGSNNLSTIFSGVITDGGFGLLSTEIDPRTKAYIGDSKVIQNPFKIYEFISSDRFAFQGGGVGGSLNKIGEGTLILSGANTYTGGTSIKRGVLQVDGSISSNTFVNWGGRLAGSGTVNGNVTNARGKISPGDALGEPGVLTIGENYTQTAGGTLFIQIGGRNPGQVSFLDVQGNANLNGFLDPVLVNGFVPEIGQSFTFLNYASFTGFFHIRIPVFDHGRKRWLLAYNPTSALLTVVENHRP
jgi:autotransporter-associated beta strand protein